MRHLLLLLSFALFSTFTSAQVQFLGSPTTTVRNRGNFVSDSLFYLPKRQKLPSDTGAIRYAIGDSSVYVWSGSQWSKLGASIDTTIISTRAWRKKGDDSLGAVIATKVNISDTATMLNPYTRGSGTVNYVPKFTATRTLGNSQIFDNGTNIGIAQASPLALLHIGAGSTGSILNGAGVTFQPQVQHTITSGVAGVSAMVNDGTNNRRAGLFVDQTNAIWGLSQTETSGSIPFVIRNSGGERLRIFANGRVGVNTTTDAGYQFDVAGSIRNTTGAAFATSSGGVLISSSAFVDANDKLQTENTVDGGYGIRIVNQSTNSAATARIVFGTQGGNYTIEGLRNGNELRFVRGTTESMRITSAGNVGIGTTSPSEVLHVVGRGRFTTIDSTSSPINVLTSDVNGVIRKTAPGVQGSGTTNYVAKFTASGTVGNSQIFDNGTNVGVGTTSPSSILHINGGTGLAHFRISEATTTRGFLGVANGIIAGYSNELALRAELGLILSGTGNAVSAYINSSGGELIIANGNTDLGDYKLQVNGNIYTSSGGVMAASSGEILIGTTVDVGDYRLQVNGNANFRDDVLIDTNLRVNRHISLDQTPKAWALGNAIEGPQGSTLFVAGGGVQTLANVYYDGSYKYSTSNPGAAMFLLQSGITFATYGSGTANGALTGANEMVYAGGELRVGIADQGTFKLQVADKSYLADEVQIASTTDLGNYKLQVTGEAIITAGIRTDAPSGGTAATWKLGTVATVSPTSPNRTIEVEIGGTTYYIHAKTTNN